MSTATSIALSATRGHVSASQAPKCRAEMPGLEAAIGASAATAEQKLRYAQCVPLVIEKPRLAQTPEQQATAEGAGQFMLGLLLVVLVFGVMAWGAIPDKGRALLKQ